MDLIVYIVIAVVAVVVGYAFGTMRARSVAAARTAEEMNRERASHRKELDEAQARAAAAQAKAAAAEARLDAERKRSEEMLSHQAEALRAEFRNVANELVQKESSRLHNDNKQTLDGILQPLKDNIATFNAQFLKGNADMNRYITDLLKQTTTMGQEANNLARALRSNNKVQGNWGELVLRNILDGVGMRKGTDYEEQVCTATAEGGRVIPDVVVKLPQNRALVVDSKVSLNAYTDYVAAEDDAAKQESLLKEHVKSVMSHVNELSKTDYAKKVKNHIGYVLMFIPSEAAYVAAVTADPNLSIVAYKKHVIIVNPTNLLMALQLAYNLWQSELQTQNVKAIYDSAEKIYAKFCTFAKTFELVGKNISTLQGNYNTALNQLTTGRNSLVGQLEKWKEQGLTSTSQIPESLLPVEED